jgi:hypothetical protein
VDDVLLDCVLGDKLLLTLEDTLIGVLYELLLDIFLGVLLDKVFNISSYRMFPSLGLLFV